MTGRGVLCSGSIGVDTLIRPVDDMRWGITTVVESMDPHVGGNGANTSITLARMGVPVRLLGATGDDEAGRFARERLKEAGVDTTWVRTVDAPTATTAVIVNTAGDRKFLHRPGASTMAFSGPIEFAAHTGAGLAHYHLGSLFILPRFREHGAETLRRAREAGFTTSLDTNWDPQGLWMADLAPCLPWVDYLFVNEDEARMVTGESTPAGAGGVLRQLGARTAVVKLGARGCAIFTGEGEVWCPAYDVDVKDTTGAGDSFVGGFLAALARGEGLEAAGQFGNAVAAMSVQTVGAVTGIPGYEQMREWLQTARVRPQDNAG